MNLNNWGPFDASIWGTVSDWFSIIVNLGAAVLIYKTLKSQVAVQKLQQRVTEIEHAEFIKKLEPKFELETQVNSPVLHHENGHRYLSFSAKMIMPLLKNPAKNIKYTCSWPWYDENEGKPTIRLVNDEQPFLNYGETLAIGVNVRVANFFNLESYVFTIKVSLEYSDINDNFYSQDISARISSDEVRKIIGNPIPTIKKTNF